jgi:sulfate adenylyltransferase subunit 1
MDLLRFLTLGSVDSGKSTLIGRLLFDSKGLFEDQLEALERSADLTGNGEINLANLTDGLRAEREQGITIDVAYRYFATPKRRFIMVDSPGHQQYTRNVVTGATTCQLAVVLVEADRGLREQARRLITLASLVGITNFLICVNKMDRVDYDQERFLELRDEIQEFLKAVGVEHGAAIPISALSGENVVDRSNNLQWYQGPSVLEYLETTPVSDGDYSEDPRFPVQWVIRPGKGEVAEFRGYAGQIASGTFRVGDPITVLPGGQTTKIRRLHTYDGDLEEARAPMSVTLLLEDELDVSRGDMLVHSDKLPEVSQNLSASLCWMGERALRVGGTYLLRQTTRTTRCIVDKVSATLDTTKMEIGLGRPLNLNDIGLVKLRTLSPVAFDSYDRNKETGSLVLIDETDHQTVAAGMLSQDIERRFGSWTRQAAL